MDTQLMPAIPHDREDYYHNALDKLSRIEANQERILQRLITIEVHGEHDRQKTAEIESRLFKVEAESIRLAKVLEVDRARTFLVASLIAVVAPIILSWLGNRVQFNIESSLLPKLRTTNVSPELPARGR